MKKQKKVVVDRKFLTELADLIYDPKTKKFLHLCDGTLQNGPDPTDEERPMHCGRGELYYAMTGRQPYDDGVGEDDVVELAVELSTFPNPEKEKERLIERTVKSIKSLKLPEPLEDRLICAAEEARDDDDIIDRADEEEFGSILNSIPTSNDDKCGDGCDVKTFRERSKRVAKKLRDAAKLLPR